MGYRGRLIWPFTARIAKLDTLATSVNGAPLSGGYDFDFKEPVKKSDGTTSRVYGNPIDLPCQVETEGDQFDRLTMRNLGDDGDTALKLVFHFQDLEDYGLVDTKGRATIPKGTKLVAIFDGDMEEIDDYESQDLVVTEAQPRSAGLSGLKRNLLLVTFKARDESTSEV